MGEIEPDGLPISEVHAWALEKHERLRRYVNAARAARRKYSSRCYVDLFCGPGRSRVIETGVLIDGSPLVAFDAAAEHGEQFSEFLIGDVNEEYARAAESRLRARGAKVRVFVGEAHLVVDQVVRALDKQGLHLAFLDPYNLGAMPFSVIERLANLKRMDLLIHVSAMDLKRELRNYLNPDGRKALDRFAPGWRRHVNVQQRQDLIR